MCAMQILQIIIPANSEHQMKFNLPRLFSEHMKWLFSDVSAASETPQLSSSV